MNQRLKPTAFYRFQQAVKSDGTPVKEKYLLLERQGADTIPLGMGKRGEGENREYVYLAPSQREQKAGGRQFEYALYTSHAEPVGKKRLMDGSNKATKARISGVNFRCSNAGRTWGDTCTPYLEGNHALLIELSPDLKTLTIAVFRDMAAQAQSLFQLWQAGEVSTTVDSTPLPETPQAA